MTMAGGSVFGDAIQEMKTAIFADDIPSVPQAMQGSVERRDIYPEYTEDVSGRFKLDRPVKVVVDCGNGSGALVAVDLLTRIGAEVIPLFCESDGTFPNHHPDPTVDEYLADLIEKVKETGADLGIAFDGDADRIGAVWTERRETWSGVTSSSFSSGLTCSRRKGPGQKLVFDVKCSQALPEVFEAAGGSSPHHVDDGPLPHEAEDEGGARADRR